jgi:uncharacterized protein
MVAGDIRFVEYGKNELEGYTLIEGFPGLGLVGTIGAKYITEKVQFEEIGHMESETFLPMIRIEKGLPVYPARIYANREKKLAVLISEQIIPKNNIYHFAKAVTGWVKSKGIKKLISLEGIHTSGEGKGSVVYAVASNAASKESIKRYNLSLVENGITTGITAIIMLELKQENIEAFSILADVKNVADYKGAAALIKEINNMLGLNIAIEPLLKEARETEKALLKQLQELKKTGQVVDKFETKTPMYT